MATALTSALGQGGHISQQWGQTSRPFETRRLEAFSVKLNRRLRLYSYPTLDHWQTLEADPAVTAFCERPTTTYIELGGDDGWPISGFGMSVSGREELLVRDAVEPRSMRAYWTICFVARNAEDHMGARVPSISRKPAWTERQRVTIERLYFPLDLRPSRRPVIRGAKFASPSGRVAVTHCCGTAADQSTLTRA